MLHAADQVAGGCTETSGLGGARENFSIDAQWDRGGRAVKLREQLVKEITETASKEKISTNDIGIYKLNVELPVVNA